MERKVNDATDMMEIYERISKIDSRLESLERSINQAAGGLRVLIWLGSIAAACATFVATFWHMISDHAK